MTPNVTATQARHPWRATAPWLAADPSPPVEPPGV